MANIIRAAFVDSERKICGFLNIFQTLCRQIFTYVVNWLIELESVHLTSSQNVTGWVLQHQP